MTIVSCLAAGQLKLAFTVQYIPLSVIGGCKALLSFSVCTCLCDALQET